MSNSERNLQPVHVPDGWAPDSWRTRPASQLPVYADAEALAEVQSELRGLPPIVTSWEILALKQQLAEAQEGKRFLLQGGDCAESFRECSSAVISNRLKVLLQMSLVLVHGLRLPVIRVGRFAGQYAKPRSVENETIDGVTLPVYRGDIVNSPAFTALARTADPRRMIKAHARSAMTMNFVRALIDGGFADLHHPEYWDLGWVGHSPLADEYQHMVAGIGDAVRFMETLSGSQVHNLNRVDFYTSHEALLLPYEEAQTREVPRQWGWFNLGTHFPWIGMRTAALGNTETTGNGYKTRRFGNIRSELEQAFELHAAAGTRVGGVHLELTGEDVTECLGGARELTETDLARAYRSAVDPRLNYEQALEIAMLIVRQENRLAPSASI